MRKLTAERAWPLAIGAVLALTVAANVAIYAAANGPGAAVPEADYYRRALAWDVTQAEHSRSVALGWTASAEFGARTPRGTPLRITLLDAVGRPLVGARVAVRGVHNLDQGRTQHWSLEPSGLGVHEAVLSLPREGRWELRVVAERGSDRFVTVLHADAGR